MRQHDNQNTPFKQNIRDLWAAITWKPRTDGRGWLDAVTHELLNVFVELVRANPKVSIFIALAVLFVLGDRIWSGDWF